MPSFFFNDTATPEISPLSLHAALPIYPMQVPGPMPAPAHAARRAARSSATGQRSEEHTSELQSRLHLVCPLFFLMTRRPPRSPLFPCTPLFRSTQCRCPGRCRRPLMPLGRRPAAVLLARDRKSTRLNSSHGYISYALFFF